MKGTQHLLIGGATGAAIAFIRNNDLIETSLIIGVSSFASLAPDLDTNGKLSRRMTISYSLVRKLIFLLGVCLAAYLILYQKHDLWIGATVLIASTFASMRFIKPKTMNIVTSLCFVGFGVYFSISWLVGLGIFFGVAAFSPHRGITHSLLGLIYFTWVASMFQSYYELNHISIAACLGYASHLLLDMRGFSYNKRGVKWFYPILSREW
ncbi:metal-dependent hydrolase [Bacillus suaedae]|uniref:Metal-dependent hydrolase n=1 Tax=Halalkalibacter suaedae TaxID=2822140 RepID=A0A940WU45_9BACI|nr:metal-dependent hydrolase [Bacillus suaedae]MBP3950268.1 metal-dependent hydrolase [Bacillus suaedae]